MSFKQKRRFFRAQAYFLRPVLGGKLYRDNNTGKDLQQLRRNCFDENLPWGEKRHLCLIKEVNSTTLYKYNTNNPHNKKKRCLYSDLSAFWEEFVEV